MVRAAARVRVCVLLSVTIAGLMQQPSSSKQNGVGLPFVAAAADNSSVPLESNFTHSSLSAPRDGNEDTSSKSSSYNLSAGILNENIRCVPRSNYSTQGRPFWEGFSHPVEHVSNWGLAENRAKSIDFQRSANFACLTAQGIRPPHTTQLSGRKRSQSEESEQETASTKQYACRFCLMKFPKSQALGGHMNRHRQERRTENWNRAFKLIQQGSPSLGLSSQDQNFLLRSTLEPDFLQRPPPTLSEHGPPNAASSKSMQYLGASSAPAGALYKEYLTESSSNAAASSAINQNVQNIDPMMLSRQPMVLPVAIRAKSFECPSLLTRGFSAADALERSKNLPGPSLHMNQTEAVSKHRAPNFLAEHTPVLAQREILPQDYPRHTDMSPLSQSILRLSSMQPNIAQEEARKGGDYHDSQERGPKLTHSAERTKANTSSAIAKADDADPGHIQSLALMWPEAETSCGASCSSAYYTNPISPYITERLKESIALASSHIPAEQLRFMLYENQINKIGEHARQMPHRPSDDPMDRVSDHRNLEGRALTAHANHQGIVSTGASEYAAQQTRVMSTLHWSSNADAHKVISRLQPLASSLDDHEGSYEEAFPFIKPD